MFALLSLFFLKQESGTFSRTIMLNELSFLLAGLKIYSHYTRVSGGNEWKLMAITLSNNTTQSTVYSYEWFIFYISSSFAFLAPSQISLPQVFLLWPLTIFQCFRPVEAPHPQLHLPEMVSTICLTLAHPLDCNLNVISSERPSLTDHSKLFCTLFSVMVLYSLLSRSYHKLCIRFFLFFTTLSLVPTPVPTHSRYSVPVY